MKRFSLRTAVLGMVVAAVGLGFGVREYVIQANDERAGSFLRNHWRAMIYEVNQWEGDATPGVLRKAEISSCGVGGFDLQVALNQESANSRSTDVCLFRTQSNAQKSVIKVISVRNGVFSSYLDFLKSRAGDQGVEVRIDWIEPIPSFDGR